MKTILTSIAILLMASIAQAQTTCTNIVWITNYVTVCPSSSTVTPFSYQPSNTVCTWYDKSGIHSGDLATFRNLADKPTVYAIRLENRFCENITLGNEFPRIVSLLCYNSSLTNLNVQGCTNIVNLQCHDNFLQTLNVRDNYRLKTLDCSNNRLDRIDVSANTNLQYLSCYNMPLTTLDISRNVTLKYIDVGNDTLSQFAVDSILYYLDLFNINNGMAAMFATTYPSESGLESAARLIQKGWYLQLDSP